MKITQFEPSFTLLHFITILFLRPSEPGEPHDRGHIGVDPFGKGRVGALLGLLLLLPLLLPSVLAVFVVLEQIESVSSWLL